MNSLQIGKPNRWMFTSIIVLICVGLIAYAGALNIDFWTDDYQFLETAGRLDWQAYLNEYFDPRVQWHWYRPVQGLAWWIGYQLFRVAPAGYHLAQVLLHVANSLWLFALTARVARRWRIGLLAALLYISLPAYSLAVYWPGVADPLVAFFFLTTLWLWLDYLERGGMARFIIAYVSCIAALLSKEIGAVLPAVLFLADRWLIAKPVSLTQLFKRYVLFAGALVLYGWLEYYVLTRGVFTQQLGYGVGGHILNALLYHLATLAFPWSPSSALTSVWLWIVLALFAYAAYRRAWHASRLFLGAAMVLTMLPILPFPPGIAFATRYLYLPLMGSMIAFALAIDYLLRARRHSIVWIASAFGVALLLGWHGTVVAEGAVNFAGAVRGERLQFRPIFQRYPSFAPGTLLYFIAPTYPNLSGLMFTRYGANVTTKGTDTSQWVVLRDYAAAMVFYRDDQNNWRDQAVDRDLNVRLAPLPTTFSEPVVLERIELASQRVKRGDALAAILYWRVTGRIGKDYTLFVHLIDANGRRVDGIDSPPRGGDPPMTLWRAGDVVSDGIVLPIDPAIAPGEYSIEIGLYDAETMRRLDIVDATGQPITDKLALRPIWIIE